MVVVKYHHGLVDPIRWYFFLHSSQIFVCSPEFNVQTPKGIGQRDHHRMIRKFELCVEFLQICNNIWRWPKFLGIQQDHGQGSENWVPFAPIEDAILWISYTLKRIKLQKNENFRGFKPAETRRRPKTQVICKLWSTSLGVISSPSNTSECITHS